MTGEYNALKPCWYLIYTHPRQEDRTDQNLRSWIVETFVPKLKERQYHPYTGKPGFVIKPLFPRYIFARFPLESHLHKIRYTRGVRDVVGFGHGPAVVSDDIIDFLRSRVMEDGYVRVYDELEPGDRVLINQGPFAGLTGLFEREMKDAQRVKILLEAVSYQAHISIDREVLKRA